MPPSSGAAAPLSPIAAPTGVAAFVAYYLARSVHSDVSFVRDRILAMTALDSAPGGQPVIVRGVDQVG